MKGNIFKKMRDFLKGEVVMNLSPKREKINKTIKYSLCFGLPLLGAILGSTLGIMDYNKNKEPNTEILVEVKTDQIKRRVYLLSKDSYTVPLSVSLEKKTSLQEQIMDVYNLLKVDSKISNQYVNGFISNDVKMNKLEIKDKVLWLDFSENILQDNVTNQKILEALTMSFVSFDEIDSIEVSVNGTNLSELLNTYVPNKLDKNIGINQLSYYTSSIINKEKQIVFYEREYSKDYSYLIPVTVYVDKTESVSQTFVDATRVSQPVSSLLKKVDLYDTLLDLQEENYTLKVNDQALIDEETVNKELFDLVSLSFDLMGISEKVSFTLEGESVSVDGIYDEEDALVNNIIINSIEI